MFQQKMVTRIWAKLGYNFGTLRAEIAAHFHDIVMRPDNGEPVSDLDPIPKEVLQKLDDMSRLASANESKEGMASINKHCSLIKLGLKADHAKRKALNLTCGMCIQMCLERHSV